MKKLILLLSLVGCLTYTIIAQQVADKSVVKTAFKEVVSQDVVVQNAFRINTPKLEFSPCYYQNGVVYVTTYKDESKIDGNIGTAFFELSFAELDGQGLPINPQIFSPTVNSSTHEGPLSFNFTEDVIYYTSNSQQKNKDGKYTMKIFAAQKDESDWQERTELPFNGESFHTMHPSLDAVGTTLYFTSNRPGGYGGTDIYRVAQTEKGWSEPVNLGPTVNTNKNEAFPLIHESGVLFFASEGHAGLGGYDLFAAKIEQSEVTDIFHFGAPLNSENADFGLILNPTGTQGYFTSSRVGGMGQDDIYLFDAPNGLFGQPAPEEKIITILVQQASDKVPIANAGVYIFEKNKNGLYGEEDLYEVVLETTEGKEEKEVKFILKKELGEPNFYTNEQGQITTTLLDQQSYLLLVTKEGYASKELRYELAENTSDASVTIPMETRKCATMRGLVKDAQTGQALVGAKIFVKSDCEEAIQFVDTDAEGRYEICLPYGCTYLLGAEKSGYTIYNFNVATKNLNQTELRNDLQLNPTNSNINVSSERLVEGSTIILENIYYDFNKSSIRAGAAEELDELATIMLQYPSMEIELTAHTDARGDRAYNRQLSRERAEAARAYLARKGISDTRIIARGMGEVAIRNHCTEGVKCTEEEHEYNRRTEVRVTKLAENVNVQYSGR